MIDSLKFSDIKSISDFNKDVEGELEEIEEAEYNRSKRADLYLGKLYTIVSETHDITSDILPSDQGILPNKVVLWNNIFTIPMYLRMGNKILEIRVDPEEIRDNLSNIGSGAYTLDFVPGFYIIREVNSFER